MPIFQVYFKTFMTLTKELTQLTLSVKTLKPQLVSSNNPNNTQFFLQHTFLPSSRSRLFSLFHTSVRFSEANYIYILVPCFHLVGCCFGFKLFKIIKGLFLNSGKKYTFHQNFAKNYSISNNYGFNAL